MDIRSKIILTAVKVFAQKGKHGAKMDHIARVARINRALLYYYFSTKDNLFREALIYILSDILDCIQLNLNKPSTGTLSPVDRMKLVIRAHFCAFSKNMDFTKVLLDAGSSELADLRYAVDFLKRNSKMVMPSNLFAFFDDGSFRKIFRKANVKQILMNIMGMVMFYFISKQITHVVFDSDDKEAGMSLEEMESIVIDWIMYGIVNPKK